MADKKYIGEPGKQDDPCWKGYEMVGMKKKGGRKVPNCVPEATDIIAKAKAAVAKKAGAKLKMDPDTGTPDHFTAAQRRKKGLDEQSSDTFPWHEDPKNPTRKVGARKDEFGNPVKNVARYLAKKAMKANEEVEDLDETAKIVAHLQKRYGDNIRKSHVRSAANDFGVDASKLARAVRTKLGKNMLDEEQIDELSVNKLDQYRSKARTDIIDADANDDNRMYNKRTKGYVAASKQVSKKQANEEIDPDLEAELKATRVTKKSMEDSKKTRERASGMKEAALYQPSAAYQASRNANPYAKQHQDSIDRRNASIKRSRDAVAERQRKKAEELRSGLKTVKEEVEGKVYSVHVKGDSKDHNSPEFKKHLKGWGGELHYASDKGAAYKFKKDYQATGFHHGVKSGFKSLDSEHDGQVKEELGKDNEWGRPELRKKFAAMTPGQESMAADKIPTFDPRYDDVPTEYCGGLKEALDNNHPIVKEYNALKKHDIKTLRGMISQSGGVVDASGFKSKDHAASHIIRSKHGNKKVDAAFGFAEALLSEISAKGAVARADFRAKIQKVLADPAAISKAKKTLAKKKAAEKAAEPVHLVMQLRKASSIGSKVQFRNGESHHVAPNHVEKFNDKYHSLKSSIEKESLINRAHKSHADFFKAIAEETLDITQQGGGPQYDTHRGNGGHMQTLELDGDEMIFADFDEKDMEELEAEVDNMTWEDIVDEYDDEELEYVDGEEEIEEGVTPQGRLKKKFSAMRNKTRRNMARNLALKRVSTPDRIKARSISTARRMVYQRFLRGRDKSSMSAAEKTRIEAQVKRLAPSVARLSVRIVGQVRKLEQSRMKNRTRGKKR